ncbi:hypothetical protein GCM10022247_56810 [Allokutzneria multivorans]|uniref:Uncharacterized protein n=1 Tax=Allokutzneria multivorans TaxID=1142134 RepID=A0ABP7TE23_9PSEU
MAKTYTRRSSPEQIASARRVANAARWGRLDGEQRREATRPMRAAAYARAARVRELLAEIDGDNAV